MLQQRSSKYMLQQLLVSLQGYMVLQQLLLQVGRG
jgi:hypothetical protein